MAELSPTDAVTRVLRRSGFGTTGTAVQHAAAQGLAETVAALYATDPAEDAGAVATPAPHFAAVAPLGKDAGTDERKKHNAALRAQLTQLTAWWVHRMVAVQNPAGERLTFAWHNHFATAATKVRNAPAMLQQNATLRSLGRGEFRPLALAMLTDPAMLRWLDGQKNTAKAPNENLSREFMELFTLGHGDGYSETDVREGAKALTGWRLGKDGRATFAPKQHAQGSKTVLGVSGDLDEKSFCDAVLAQPGSAKYVATRMWQHFASAQPPSASTLTAMTSAYGSSRDITAMLTALFGSEEFRSSQTAIVVSPLEWTIGAMRALKVPVDWTVRPTGNGQAARPAAGKAKTVPVASVLGTLRGLGQLPFYPPNVSGWPSGQAWLSTAATQLRARAATQWVNLADLDVVSSVSATSRPDAVGHLLGVPRWSPRTATALKALAGDPRRLVAVALNTPEYLTA